jgi:hypothetical protein
MSDKAPSSCNVSFASEVAQGDSIKLTALARERKLDPSCVFRWATKGLPGRNGRVVLEALRLGRSWVTSRAAVARFFSQLPHSPSGEIENASPAVPRPRSARDRQEADQYAADRLREKGF